MCVCGVCVCVCIYIYIYIYTHTGSLAQWIECSPMFWETGVQSQVESYQRLFKKWYLVPPCLTLSIIRYVSRVKWSSPGKGVSPSPTPRCSSYWKESLCVTLDYSCQLYLYKYDLTLNNPQGLTCHKTQPTNLIWWPATFCLRIVFFKLVNFFCF